MLSIQNPTTVQITVEVKTKLSCPHPTNQTSVVLIAALKDLPQSSSNVGPTFKQQPSTICHRAVVPVGPTFKHR